MRFPFCCPPIRKSTLGQKNSNLMKLLIVDDSELMRNTIKSIVTRPGDETAECSDGNGVLKAYEQFQPDWVLMDIRMPGVNGIQATRNLKTTFPHSHIAILTSYNKQEYQEETFKAGAEAYFLKDNLPALRSQLENLFKPT